MRTRAGGLGLGLALKQCFLGTAGQLHTQTPSDRDGIYKAYAGSRQSNVSVQVGGGQEVSLS